MSYCSSDTFAFSPTTFLVIYLVAKKNKSLPRKANVEYWLTIASFFYLKLKFWFSFVGYCRCRSQNVSLPAKSLSICKCVAAPQEPRLVPRNLLWSVAFSVSPYREDYDSYCGWAIMARRCCRVQTRCLLIDLIAK